MKRGQTQVYLLVLGIIWMVTIFALFGTVQSFAQATVNAANPPYPAEVAALILLGPFFAVAMITFGIIVAVARPGVGF